MKKTYRMIAAFVIAALAGFGAQASTGASSGTAVLTYSIADLNRLDKLAPSATFLSGWFGQSGNDVSVRSSVGIGNATSDYAEDARSANMTGSLVNLSSNASLMTGQSWATVIAPGSGPMLASISAFGSVSYDARAGAPEFGGGWVQEQALAQYQRGVTVGPWTAITFSVNQSIYANATDLTLNPINEGYGGSEVVLATAVPRTGGGFTWTQRALGGAYSYSTGTDSTPLSFTYSNNTGTAYTFGVALGMYQDATSSWSGDGVTPSGLAPAGLLGSSVSAVPEASTTLLMASGLCALAFVGRLRRAVA
jgi:hypothetical protein